MRINQRSPRGLLRAALGLAVALAVALSPAPALAAPVDASRQGSITVTMTHDGAAVGGGTLTVYRVGQVAYDDDGNARFELVDGLRGSGVSLDGVGTSEGSAEVASALAAQVASAGIAGTTVEVSSSGVASFADLELGLYLVLQETAASGYTAAEPFLVSVPMVEDGVYVYDVDASPKVSLTTSPTPDTPPDTPRGERPHGKLPQTGQLNWPIPALVLLGLSLVIVGTVVVSRAERRDAGASGPTRA